METNNKLRDALIEARRFVFAAMQGQRDILVNDGINEPYVIKPKDTLSKIDAALAEPVRNCDRFGGDIEKLREACLRERGLNPDEDFPEIFCEWLLAKAKGENDGSK